jgi:hypothetical protein
VTSQFINTELESSYHHLVIFSVSINSCSTHIRIIFDLVPCVHKHGCICVCNLMSQILKMCRFPLIDDTHHITPEEEV